MKGVIVAIAAAVQISTPIQQQAEVSCHLAKGIAVGCVEGGYYAPTNAVTLYDKYGYDKARLLADYTKVALREYNCAPLRDDGTIPDLRFEAMQLGRVATVDGWRPVVRLGLYRPQHASIWWIAKEYLSEGCRPPKQATQAK
jgi:hypothetical protein